MNVLDVEDGLIVRITSFGPPFMGAFDLPRTLEGAVMRRPRTR
jgi:hypothetical protein